MAVACEAAEPVPYRGVSLEDQLDDNAKALAFARRLEHSLSPDGGMVAYVAKKLVPTYFKRAPTSFYSTAGVPDMYQGAAIWIMDLDTQQRRALAADASNTWNARWSPDGRYLAFLSDKYGEVNLFVWDRSTATTAEFRQRAIFAEVFPENSPSFEWAQNSREILFQAIIPPPAVAPDPAAFSTQVFNQRAKEHVNPFSFTEKGRVDLCIANVTRKDVRTLVSNADLLSFRVAPRGNRVALFGNVRQAANALQNLMDLYIVDVPEGGPDQALAWSAMRPQVKDVKEWTGQSLAWAPDGTRLAFLTAGAQASGDIYVWDTRNGQLSNITANVPAVPGGTRALDYSEKFSIWYYLSWMPDSSAVFGLTRRPKQGSELWRVPVKGGAAKKLLQGPPRAWLYLMTSATSASAELELVDGSWLAVQESAGNTWQMVNAHTGASSPATLKPMAAQLLDTAADAQAAVRLGVLDDDLWVYKEGPSQPIRVSNFAEQLQSRPLGTAQTVQGSSLDGEALTGLLLLPPSATQGHTVPLVVHVYAGRNAPALEELSDRGGESWLRNCLLAHGYAVLYASIPNHFRAQWPGAILVPVLSQVDAAVRTGAVDPKRVGVYGHSFGGYTVNMLVTHTKRFQAAVSVASISDATSHALAGERADTIQLSAAMTAGAQPGLGATPWGDARRYIANSPIYHLAEVSTPLLLMHGDADISVPIEQSEEIYHGLISLGKKSSS